MSADDRAERVARIRWEIGKMEEQIRQIEGPDRCEVCQFRAGAFEEQGLVECARYPARVEVADAYWCGEFKRR